MCVCVSGAGGGEAEWELYGRRCELLRVRLLQTFTKVGHPIRTAAHYHLSHWWLFIKWYGKAACRLLSDEAAEHAHKRPMQDWADRSTQTVVNPSRRTRGNGASDMLATFTLFWTFLRDYGWDFLRAMDQAEL